MSKTTVMPVDVRFGDCDPAGIVFFPNFHRWLDASSLHFFMQCGVPPWYELTPVNGIIGTPLLEHNTRFVKTATFGERIEVHTCVSEWRARTFVHTHRVMRDGELLCEGTEVRAFCIRDPQDPKRIRAIPVPPEYRAMCEQDA
jgi:4-hydroxybenzoyl-CoA thioesterase